MINIKEIDWSEPGVKLNRIQNGIEGKPIAFVVGSEVAYTLPTDKWFSDLLLSIDTFLENIDYPAQEGVYMVDLIKDGVVLDQLVCDELLYSILLSDPKIIHICEDYENYKMAAPGWHFANNKFYIPEMLNYDQI